MKNTARAYWCRKDSCQAVELRRGVEGYEWLEAGAGASLETVIGKFPVLSATGDKPKGGAYVAAGFDSSQAIFYRFELPDAAGGDFDDMVRLQVERLLPISPNEVEIFWSRTPCRPGVASILAAGIRREVFERNLQRVTACQPKGIFFSGEAVVAAIQKLSSIAESHYVILDIGESSTGVYVVCDRRLYYSVSLEYGWDGLCGGDGDRLGDGGDGGAARGGHVLIQDVRYTLDRLKLSGHTAMPVILAHDHPCAGLLVSVFREAGITARLAKPDFGKIKVPSSVGENDSNDYLVPIGLAMLALDGDHQTINLMPPEPEAESVQKPIITPKTGFAAAMLLMFLLATCLFVWYRRDARELMILDQYSAKTGPSVNINTLYEEQHIRQGVAPDRPDMLELIALIRDAQVDDIVLNDLAFRKNQRLRMSGTCREPKTFLQFQQNLQKNPNFSSVRAEQVTRNEKDRMVQFTLTMDYRQFTRKKSAL